jgi:multiple sugar transport system permease protein
VSSRRESLLSYLIVGPFAIVLAFPFYWMLMTALRADNDLYDIQQVPFKFNADSPTAANFRFLF